jgi:hypothetical protein
MPVIEAPKFFDFWLAGVRNRRNGWLAHGLRYFGDAAFGCHL